MGGTVLSSGRLSPPGYGSAGCREAIACERGVQQTLPPRSSTPAGVFLSKDEDGSSAVVVPAASPRVRLAMMELDDHPSGVGGVAPALAAGGTTEC